MIISLPIDIETLCNGMPVQYLKELRAGIDKALALREGTFYQLTDSEKALTDQNQIIQAIKEYRARTGSMLKDSKDVVEAYLYRSSGKPKFIP